MAIFGCDFIQFLDRHVVLPKNADEVTVFNEFNQQKKPLKLRDEKFKEKLKSAIENIKEKINREKIVRP